MIKKGTVNRVTPNGSWEGQYGLMYKFEIEINDDIGEYLSKSQDQNRFVVGQETDYEFVDGKFPKIKPVSNFQPRTSFKKDDNVQEYIIKQSSLKCATDLCIARGVYNHEDIIAQAELFADWVLNRNQPLPFS
jgi:hypothetical protein